MKLINCALFFLISGMIPHPSAAQEQVTIDAQFRDRFEVRDGYQKIAAKGSTPAIMVSQRTRLGVAFETGRLQFKFSPQDVRLWGEEDLASSTGVFGDYASLEMFEGYVSIEFGNWGSISTGRQQLVYDSKRLLGNRNWNQNGIAYDAVVLKMNLIGCSVHAGGAWNTYTASNSDNYYPRDRIKSLDFLWINKDLNQRQSLSLMHMASGVTSSNTTNTIRFRQTTGIYTVYRGDELEFWGDAYYQYGKNSEGLKVNAWLVDADVSLRIGRLVPGMGTGIFSGNRETGPGLKKDHAFDVLYGNRHKYFGFMDYFRNNTSHTGQGGLVDCYYYLDYRLSDRLKVRNTGHYFQLACINPSTPDTRGLGYENDLILNIKFSDWGALEGGYLFFLPTEALVVLQGVPDHKFSQFFYLQLTVNTVLFTWHKSNNNT